MFQRFREQTKGFKTILVMLPVVILSILDQLGTIDLKPILIGFGLTEAQASLAPGIVAVLAIVMRSLSTTPVGKRE